MAPLQLSIPMSDAELNAFLSSLPLRDSTCPPRKISKDKAFPLMVPKEAVLRALEGWLGRLHPDTIYSGDKEYHPILMTSAPTGSGKTTFLSLMCQLF